MWCGFMRVGGDYIGNVCINESIGSASLHHHDIAEEGCDIKQRAIDAIADHAGGT